MSRAWPAAAAGATFLFALYGLWDSFLAVLVPGFFAFVQLLFLTATAAGAGRLLLRLLGLSDLSDSQRTLIGATLGLGLLCLLLCGLAAAGLLKGWAVLGTLALLWVAAFTEMRAVLVSFGANHNLLRDRPLPAAAVGLLLLLPLWACLAPPHQYDSLVYHLPLPAAYLRAGGFVKLDHFLYGHFPQNAELLFSLALLAGSDTLAQMLMWLCTALSVWWVFELGKREAPLSAVLLSCFLLAGHTSVMLLASTTYVEPLVMLWVSAAVFSFQRWQQVNVAAPRARSWLFLSAVFTGLALGTKYYAGITAALLALLLLGRALRAGRPKEGLADLALFVLVAAGLFAPWLVKNWLYVGNPVFPFFNWAFPGAGTGFNEAFAKGYFSAVSEYRHVGTYWRDLIGLAFMLLRNDPRFGGGMDVLGRLGWELVFWSLPLAAWAAWRNGFLRGLLVFCALYLLAWFSTGVVLRFLLAVAPLLCLLAGCGLYALWSALGRGGRAVFAGAVGILCAVHLLLFGYVHGVFATHEVLLGLAGRSDFLARRLDYYPCARFASERLDKNARLLIVGEQRSYYLDRPHEATTVHAPNPFLTAANEAETPQALAERLRPRYDAFIFVPREAARLGDTIGTLTERGRANWEGLEKRFLVTAFSGPACLVRAWKSP